MKSLLKFFAYSILSLLMVGLVSCDLLFPVKTSPYGVVVNAKGNPVADAKVEVYRNSVAAANKLELSDALTSSLGAFSLTNPVEAKGGTYVVRVRPPLGSTLVFDDFIVEVPPTTTLGNLGTIRAKSVQAISGKVVNVRAASQIGNIPTLGSIEIRKFGAPEPIVTKPIAIDGSFEITGIPAGSYLLTYKGDTSGSNPWFGVPVSITIAGDDITDIGAFVFKDVPVGAILLISTWNDRNYDIDSYALVDTNPSTDVVSSSPYYIYHERLTLDQAGLLINNTVSLERNVTRGDINTGAYPVETVLVSSLDNAVELRYYVKAQSYQSVVDSGSISGLDYPYAFNPEGNLDPAYVQLPAGVTVYAMQQFDSQTADHFGTWYAPLDTAEKVIGMARVLGEAEDINGEIYSTIAIGSFGSNFAITAGVVGGSSPRGLVPTPTALEGVEVQCIR